MKLSTFSLIAILLLNGLLAEEVVDAPVVFNDEVVALTTEEMVETPTEEVSSSSTSSVSSESAEPEPEPKAEEVEEEEVEATEGERLLMDMPEGDNEEE